MMDINHKERFSLEELARLPSFYRHVLSHDKQHVAFYSDQSGQIELYVMAVQPDAQPRQVSHGEMPLSPRAGFCWTPDQQWIIYAKDHNGDEQHNLWRIHVQTGHAEQLTNNPRTQQYPIEVLADGTTVIVFANLHGQMHLYSFDLNTHRYTQLTDYPRPVLAYTSSTDGKLLVYAANETEQRKNRDIYLMNVDGSEKRRLLCVQDGSDDSAAGLSSDNRLLAVNSDFSGTNRVGLYDIQTQVLRWLTPEDENHFGVGFSPDDSTLLTLHTTHATVGIVTYDVVSGASKPLALPPGVVSGVEWLDDRRLLINLSTDITRPELWEYTLEDDSTRVILAAQYGSVDPRLFTKSDYICYRSFDGLEIHAIVYRPRHMTPGVRYPALVEAHGGSMAHFTREFDPYAQFLANQGYIVIQPNVRGSTGYGTAFRDMADMDWGGGNLEDLVYAAKYLHTLPEVDPQRIGVWGGSYGGYLTYMAVTKRPEFWKVGIAWVGITDLLKNYGSDSEHYKHFTRTQMGDPQEHEALWRDRSPINFVHQMTAHLMILHGVNDPRCKIEQARLFRDRLRELGRIEGQDFEYHEFTDEGHGSFDIEQKLRTYVLVVDYLDRRL